MPQPRVLVVEDEAVIRDLIVETLVEAGFQVEEAGTADDAVRLIDADGFGLLITDVHMPGTLDGIDLARRAQSHKPALPVIVITGRPDVVHRLRGAGINGTVLPKPFMFDDLVKAAARYVIIG
jgi:DNA-binding response OmpR family regulator